jgi:predicted ATPase
MSDATGRSWEAELLRQRAELLLALNPSKTAEAETYLKKSLEVARRQNSKSLELRAGISLVNLWQQQERINEARDLIEPIYRWFNEGTATSDLRRARDLLTALH